ncbi:MAG: hypothetical protein HKN25_14075 [Pyrinomonadaceae bacterium]|nr:hypothetical protein [Pyrinomonadaceae bacterium]
MEILGFAAIGLGLLLMFIGWIWLIVSGFKTGGALWGILNIFFQPITGIIFCFVHKTGWVPLILMIIGIVIYSGGLIPIVMSNMDKIPQ